MGGHVMIVDRDHGRRGALRAALGLPDVGTHDLDDPADLPLQVAVRRPDLLLLDLESHDDAALDALRQVRARPGTPLPVLALVPPGRPELRLAALRAGAEEATARDTAARILQARIRSLLRTREAALESEMRDGGGQSLTGLAEAPSAFLPASASQPVVPVRARVGLLDTGGLGAGLPPGSLERHLDAEVLPLSGDRIRTGGADFDLVVIDAAGIRDDLAEGARILALLAELRGRSGTRHAATLLLLPASAIETAALALDLGASDVVTGPTPPEEIALRARALVGRHRHDETLRDRLRLGLRAALTDHLTGLPNRRYAETALRRIAEGARLSGRGFALMMLDIDHFKPINDRHGHAAGDRVLAEVARRLKADLRPDDVLARVGGEEFLLALPDTTAEAALAVAERLRREIGARPIAIATRPGDRDDGLVLLPCSWPRSVCPLDRDEGAHEVRVTVSIGVALADPSDSDLTGLLQRADHALYAAKRAGRDSVAAAPGPA